MLQNALAERDNHGKATALDGERKMMLGVKQRAESSTPARG